MDDLNKVALIHLKYHQFQTSTKRISDEDPTKETYGQLEVSYVEYYDRENDNEPYV